MALSLLKHQCFLEDTQGREAKLQYVRIKDKKEVDFCLVEDGKIQSFIEVKVSDKNPAPQLAYFHKKYHHPAIQLVKNLRLERSAGGLEIRRAATFLSKLER